MRFSFRRSIVREPQQAAEAPGTPDDRVIPRHRIHSMLKLYRRGISAQHAAIPQLRALDADLLNMIRLGHIRLVRADFVLSGEIERFVRRQDLEALERDSDIQVFLPPHDAASILERGKRSVAVLTYGWATCAESDCDGTYLRALVRFLQSEPYGGGIAGVFVDYMCLTQKPRTAEESLAFRSALSVMAGLYASPIATIVLRHGTLPNRPPAFDGDVVLAGGDGSELEEAAVRRSLQVHGELSRLEREEENDRDGRWRARYMRHDDAQRAVNALASQRQLADAGLGGITACYTYFNDRPYFDRG